MELSTLGRPIADDLQKLRTILGRASALAREHGLTSVMVGMAGPIGDPDFPEVVDFVESELRMEDAIFRLTRERVVLFVADVGRTAAEEIMKRILIGYSERSSRLVPPQLALSYFQVPIGVAQLTVKDVLPALFAADVDSEP
jgi:hypothetical protein